MLKIFIIMINSKSLFNPLWRVLKSIGCVCNQTSDRSLKITPRKKSLPNFSLHSLSKFFPIFPSHRHVIFYLLLKKVDKNVLISKQKSLLWIFPKVLKIRLKYSHVEKLKDNICQNINKIYKLRKMLYLKILFIADSGVLKGSEATLIIAGKILSSAMALLGFSWWRHWNQVKPQAKIKFLPL